MTSTAPRFLLYSKVERRKHQGEWKFALHTADGAAHLEAQDNEPDAFGERLELLAVLRGLEALDQPSAVTVYTSSRYVHQGYEYGLDEWRRNGWNWERYGELTPVKNRDLWQRLDRARRVHHIKLRRWRIDEAHTADTKNETQPSDEPRVVLNRRPSTSGRLAGPHFKPIPLWQRVPDQPVAEECSATACPGGPWERWLRFVARKVRGLVEDALGRPLARVTA